MIFLKQYSVVSIVLSFVFVLSFRGHQCFRGGQKSFTGDATLAESRDLLAGTANVARWYG